MLLVFPGFLAFKLLSMRRTSSLNYFSTTTHSSIADKIKKCSSLMELEHVYASLIKTGETQDAFFTTQFIAACSTFSRVDYAIRAFTQIGKPNVFVVNAMIRGFVHCGYPYSGLECYVDMLRVEILPTSYTFPPLMKACASLLESGFGEALHGHIWRNGLSSHVYVQTSMVDFYSKLCRIREARMVFDEMPERDAYAWTTMISAHARAGDMGSAGLLFQRIPERNTATWNTMIDGYGRSGNVESAELLFKQMPSRDIVSWTTMITCYSQNKRYREALAVFKDMIVSGARPDGVTMATVISACAHLGALELGKEMHLFVMQNGFGINVFIGSALVDMYAKCGALDRSLLVFFNLGDKNLFCWNSIIEGLASHGHAEKTLTMFSKMVKEKIKPNGVTFISVLSACTHAGLVEEGRRWFSRMKNDYSIVPEVEHYGCMVDLLSKAGLLEEALDLIRSMKIKPNSVIWGALLGGCKLHKNLMIGKVAVSKLMALEPNNSGYYHLLVNIFAEENRWGEVKTTWTTMKELGVEKKSPGSSWIELESTLHQFSASDRSHPATAEIYFLLNELNGQLKLACYVPDLSPS